jgi:hypothetical protein
VTVQKGFAFGNTEPPAGDAYPVVQTTRQSTAGGLGNETAHGDVARWDAARHNACGEKPGQSAGFALNPNGFSTMPGDGGPGDHDGDTPSNSSGYGKGIAGTDSFSSHGYKDSDTGSDTSGYGKGIGNTDPLRRSNQI